ncbi:MAG: PAC2 family protein [Aquiluna sp.]|nr:PAC2 family protein [Aquiluna sp.]
MSDLYELSADADLPSGLPMVALITGFSDSGATVSQLSDHLFSELNYELVLRFSNDELLDYRSRRPTLFFEKDHIQSYEAPSLAIYLVSDEAQQQFLLLAGYEPDLKWEGFSRAISEIVDSYAIPSFTWVHSIPFPIPHTRQAGVTVSGNRADMIARFSEWKPQTQVPGNVTHLLEYTLSKQEVSTSGFVLLVPHYLADNEVPSAAITGLELLSAATGLVFPSDGLREEAAKFAVKVEKQISENQELAKLVQTLEQGYANGTNGIAKSPIGKPSGQPPSVDELADDLESYLSAMQKNTDQSE